MTAPKATQPTVVWTEIPVRDLAAAEAFYSTVFGFRFQRDETGPNPILNFSDAMDIVSGHLYPGKPANGEGPTIHLNLPGTLEEGCAACTKAGGTVLSPTITIPPGRFAYAQDPDGNSIGLFEHN
jgi:predicted enzyme related to lactoylglutathione lyase